MTAERARVVAALSMAIDETRLLFHRLKQTAEVLHRQGEFSAGRRGVLRSLNQSGPQTVPQLARARPVSRQHIQMLVNPVIEEGYAEYVENPAHKRSKLIRLTEKGRILADEMDAREIELLQVVAGDFAFDEVVGVVAGLRRLREVLASSEVQDEAKRIGR